MSKKGWSLVRSQAAGTSCSSIISRNNFTQCENTTFEGAARTMPTTRLRSSADS